MVRIFIQLLALIFLLLALITAVLDITRSIADSSVVITPLGLDWFNYSPQSLNKSQEFVQNYINPYLWDPIVQTILKAPSWFVFGSIWLILSLIVTISNQKFQTHLEQ